MSKEQLLTVLIVLVAAVVILTVFLLIYNLKKRKARKQFNLTNGDRSNDVFLQRGVEYPVLTDSKFTPGRYQITTDGLRNKYLNLRITGFIKEFKRNSFITLEDNDKITALSEDVILRKVIR